METRGQSIIGVDTEEIAELELDSIRGVSGGHDVVTAITDSRSFRTMQSSWIEIDLGEEVDTYRDCTAAQDVCVLADDTIFLISGGVALNKRTVTEPRQVFIGPGDEYVTVFSKDGRLHWLNPSAKLQKVGTARSSLNLDSPSGVITSGYGWTIIGTNGEIICHQEPVDGHSSVVEVDLNPIVSGESITALSITEGTAIVATEEEVLGLDISTDSITKSWESEDYSISYLSNPAEDHIYGWSDAGVFRILASGDIELICERDIEEIQTSTNHSIYYFHDEERITISEWFGSSSVSLLIDSIQYNSNTVLQVEIENETPTSVSYDFQASVDGGEFTPTGENSMRISVPPLSSQTHTIGKLITQESVESLSVSLFDEISQSEVINQDINVEHGKPDVQAKARPTKITDGDLSFEVEVTNSGTGLAQVSFSRSPTSEEIHTISQGESEVIQTPSNRDPELLYVTGTDPFVGTQSISIERDIGLPEDRYSVSSRLGSDEGTIRTSVRNLTDVTIEEDISIEALSSQQLKGEISIPPQDEIEIWHPTPSVSTPIVPITIRGNGVIGESQEQVYTHPFLHVERRFFDIAGERLKPDSLPIGEPFEEELFIRNTTDDVVRKLSISGTEEFIVEDFPPNESVSVSRDIVLPTQDVSIPSVNIADKSISSDAFYDDRSVQLSVKWKASQLEQPYFIAMIYQLEDRTYMSFKVKWEQTQGDYISLDELRLSSTSIPTETVRDTFESGRTYECTVEIDPTIDVEDMQPTPVEAVFTSGSDRRSIRKSTLAPIKGDSTAPSLNPIIRPINNSVFDPDRQVLEFDSELDFDARIKVYAGQEQLKDVKKSFCADSITKVQFKSKSRELIVSVTGLDDHSFESKYTFTRDSEKWIFQESSTTKKFSEEPVVTPWSKDESATDH